MKAGRTMTGSPLHILCLVVIIISFDIQAEVVDELTTEQAQQIGDNFQALRDSLDQGKEEIDKLQEKIAKIKQTSEWLNDKNYGQSLQQTITRLENNGLSSKLNAARESLDTISRSADLINDKAEQIKGHYDKVKEFYDKWHPDRNNPVRPLELVANGLEKLESIIQKIDPSPDNVLTKPITAFINYYKEASNAFAGSLTRLQAQIEERRQHCIGVGCEDYSQKAKAFSAKFPGVGPAWTYRPLQEGEIWYDGDGRAFLWWHDNWEELQGGLSRFEEVYHGWLLAHKQVIATSTLVARMNTNYAKVTEAKNRAARYWIMLNSADTCHGELFMALKQQDIDRDRILKDADNDRDTFIARYMFAEKPRTDTDNIVNAFSNTLLVKGIVTDENGNSVEGAQISGSSPAGKISTSSRPGGWFSLQFNLKPDDTSHQNATVSVAHDNYATNNSEQRLWHKCEDWRITLRSKESNAADNESVADMQSIRDAAFAKAAEIEKLCNSIQADSKQISSMLDASTDSNIGKQNASPDNAADEELAGLARQAESIARESDTLAKSLAESSKGISGRVNTACEKSGLIKTAAGNNEAQQLYRDIRSAQDQAQRDLVPLRSGFARLNELSEQAATIKHRVETLHSNTPATQSRTESGGKGMQAAQQIMGRAHDTLAVANAKLQELETLRTRAAYIVSQSRKQSTAQESKDPESVFADITSARDRSSACIQANNAQLGSLASRIEERATGKEDSGAVTATPQSPGEVSTDTNRILTLADEAINNAAIAGRFFSVAEMENRVKEGAACLASAESAMSRPQQGGLSAALDNCDITTAENYLAQTPEPDPQLLQRFEQLKQKEMTAEAGMKQADAFYNNCRFDEAANVLSSTSRMGVCEKTLDKVMRSILAVKAAGKKYAAAEQAYADADYYYQQGDYEASYRRLQSARTDATCPAQVTKIDNGLEQVAQKLNAAQAGTPQGNVTGGQTVAGAATTNPVCEDYQRKLYELSDRQQQLSTQVQQAQSEEQARYIGNSVMQNSRQIMNTMEQARLAGCHDNRIPPEVRSALGMPPEQAAGGSAQTAGLQCEPPRVPGISNKTGQPACLCPGDLMWSEKRQQCMTLGQLLHDEGAMDDLSRTLE